MSTLTVRSPIPEKVFPISLKAMQTGSVRVKAHSSGRYPILVVELENGELRTAYYEAGYALKDTKLVQESWLHENAIGRHGFIEVKPPKTLNALALKGYVESEVLGDSERWRQVGR